ncbi:MAG TPA: single-stranded DNA-binding protein [Allocoleopsis sp.]
MANTITVIGNLGNDAEKRFTPNGTVQVSFTVADNIYYRGEKKTQWFSCTMFGQRAEKVLPYLTKGTQVAVFGEFATNEASNGKTYLNINLDNLTLVGPRAQVEQTAEPATDGLSFEDDEIPF